MWYTFKPCTCTKQKAWTKRVLPSLHVMWTNCTLHAVWLNLLYVECWPWIRLVIACFLFILQRPRSGRFELRAIKASSRFADWIDKQMPGLPWRYMNHFLSTIYMAIHKCIFYISRGSDWYKKYICISPCKEHTFEEWYFFISTGWFCSNISIKMGSLLTGKLICHVHLINYVNELCEFC